MLWGAFDFIVGLASPNSGRGRPPDVSGDLDVATDRSPTIFDLERLQADEDGDAIANTQFIEDKNLIPSGGKLPPGTVPTFDEVKPDIIAAAKCASCVLIEETDLEGKKTQRYFGTAFFVSEHLLLTAGHNTFGVNGRVTQVSITPPGLHIVNLREFRQRKVTTIVCKVVGSIYKRDGPPSTDLSILDSGSYRHPTYLPLAALLPLANAVVDVIGYPGEIRREWIESQEWLRDPKRSQQEATLFFPPGRLTVTRGTVESSNATIIYQLSTCPGLGGSCVLYNGTVIGVHVGRFDKSLESLPMAVSFSGEEVQRFLRKHGLDIK